MGRMQVQCSCKAPLPCSHSAVSILQIRLKISAYAVCKAGSWQAIWLVLPNHWKGWQLQVCLTEGVTTESALMHVSMDEPCITLPVQYSY